MKIRQFCGLALHRCPSCGRHRVSICDYDVSLSEYILLARRKEDLHDLILSLVLSTLNLITLLLQPLQLFLEHVNLRAQSLAFDLQLVCSFGDSELFSVQC